MILSLAPALTTDPGPHPDPVPVPDPDPSPSPSPSPALTRLVAVAQRAKTGAGTASICVVDVPPVTTYHDMTTPLVSTLHSALLEQPQQGVTMVAIDGADSYGHKVDSYSHGHAHHARDPPPPEPTAHGHSHSHAHGGDCCGADHGPKATGATHEHGHGQQLEQPAHPPPGFPGMWRDPSTGESLLGAGEGVPNLDSNPGEGVSPGTWRALSGHGGGTVSPGSGHSHSPL